MRARSELKDLLAEWDSIESFDSAMDAADFLTGLIETSRRVVAEFDELYDANGDQAWEIGDDVLGRTMLYRNDGGAQLFWMNDIDPFTPHGEAYTVLRAIYGGEPDSTGR